MLTRVALFVALCLGTALVSADNYAARFAAAEANYTQLFATAPGSAHCNLINGFTDVCNSAAAKLNAADKTTCLNMVNSMESTIVTNETLTVQQKTQACAEMILELNVTNTNIYQQIQFVNITGWSVVSNLVQMVQQWNLESVLELSVLTNGGSSCSLCDSLMAAAQANGDATLTAALSAFIQSDIMVIVKKTSLTNAEMMGEIYNAFLSVFFAQYPQYEATLMGFQLSGFGSFNLAFQVSATYYQESSVGTIMSGSGYDCPLILALNASLSDSSLSLSQRGQIKQMINYLIQKFQSTTDITVRMQIVSQEFCQFIDLNFANFFLFGEIEIYGFGSFYELIMYSINSCCLPSTVAPGSGEVSTPGGTTSGSAEFTATPTGSGSVEVTGTPTGSGEVTETVTGSAEITGTASGSGEFSVSPTGFSPTGASGEFTSSFGTTCGCGCW